MTTGATGQLGLALPVQGELSGTWGNTVNNGITEYTNIAIAGTLTLTDDGAVTLANTTGDASASNITSSLTGAGTVTAQFAIVKVTGTLTTAKVVTAPSYSKTYVVDNTTATYAVTFKASGQTGVSIVAGEKATVYFNGTDYVKVASTTADGVTTFSAGTTGFTPSTATSGAVTLAGTLATTNGGTGLTSFTANGVAYASSTSALATGSALQFDGANLGVGGAASYRLGVIGANAGTTGLFQVGISGVTNGFTITTDASNNVVYSFLTGTTAQGLYQNASGNVGIGVTPSAWSSASTPALQLANGAALFSRSGSTFLSQNFFYNSSDTGTYIANGFAAVYNQVSGQHQWFNAPSGTAGNTAALNQVMTLDASGNLGVGTTSPTVQFAVQKSSTSLGVEIDTTSGFASGPTIRGFYRAGAAYTTLGLTGSTVAFGINDVEKARLDSAGYLSGVWADKVTALGNSGTATTITCTSGNVFTSTLTGNCTFTLSAPSTTTANTATSFTLILTNDGTAGRTVAFSGGTFKYPGGSVTRTTTANAVDIWFFFSPNGGTTWYVSIPMANLS